MSRIACVLGLTLAGLAGQAAECFGDHLITITGGVFWQIMAARGLECPSRAISSLRVAPVAAASVPPVCLRSA